MSEIYTTGRKGFTGELWHSIEDVYARVLDHPFLTGLTDGTLPEESFRYTSCRMHCTCASTPAP